MDHCDVRGIGRLRGGAEPFERDLAKSDALARERLDVINDLEADAAAQAKRIQEMEGRLRAAKAAMADLKRDSASERTRAETLQAVVASIAGQNGPSSA